MVNQLCRLAGADQHKITMPRSRDRDLRHRENCQQVVKQQDIVIHSSDWYRQYVGGGRVRELGKLGKLGERGESGMNDLDSACPDHNDESTE